MSVIVSVKCTAIAGQEGVVRDRLMALASAGRETEGCVCFLLHRDTENSLVYMVYEEWSDQDTLQAWIDSDFFQREAVGVLMPACADVERIELELIP